MSGSDTEIVYWDTCIFYVLFKREDHHGDGVLEGIVEEYEKFRAGKLKLVTSIITVAEVAAGNFDDPADFKKFRDLKYAQNFEFTGTTHQVMELTSEIRDYYYHHPHGPNGEFKHVGLGDAIHLATAIAREASHFVTIDERNKTKASEIGLLKLKSPLADKYPLNIRRPIPKKGQITMELVNGKAEKAVGEIQEGGDTSASAV